MFKAIEVIQPDDLVIQSKGFKLSRYRDCLIYFAAPSANEIVNSTFIPFYKSFALRSESNESIEKLLKGIGDAANTSNTIYILASPYSDAIKEYIKTRYKVSGINPTHLSHFVEEERSFYDKLIKIHNTLFDIKVS